MRSFEASRPPAAGYRTVDTPTYLLARDEDCENSFHSTADFVSSLRRHLCCDVVDQPCTFGQMNMFVVQTALGLDPADTQVMLFDKHPDGPYHELISRAFSANHPVLRHGDYRGQRVLFRRLVFHLESPAALIFPKVRAAPSAQCSHPRCSTGFCRCLVRTRCGATIPVYSTRTGGSCCR